MQWTPLRPLVSDEKKLPGDHPGHVCSLRLRACWYLYKFRVQGLTLPGNGSGQHQIVEEDGLPARDFPAPFEADAFPF